MGLGWGGKDFLGNFAFFADCRICGGDVWAGDCAVGRLRCDLWGGVKLRRARSGQTTEGAESAEGRPAEFYPLGTRLLVMNDAPLSARTSIKLRSLMKPVLSLSCLLAFTVSAIAAAPVVTNVTAAQRPGSKLVDITYTVNDGDGDSMTIGVEISGDGGLTYTIPATALSGNVGAGVTSGNRSIVWNAGADWNGQYVPLARVRITAHDGTTPAPPTGMVYIPAGVFQMGDNLDGMTNAMPVHNVQVDGFFMERFEVSKELWMTVKTWSAGNGYDDFPDGFAGPGHPVCATTWYAAVKWCNARSEKEGLTPVYYTDDAQTVVYRTGNLDLANAKVKWNANGYRLPTEAEWEKAARGGSLGLRYPWGNTIDGSQANFQGSGDQNENSNLESTPVGYYNGSQAPVGVDMANGYGLYDMIGNVREWCWDRYSDTYYSSPLAGENPRGPDSGGPRLARGGSWGDGAGSPLRIAYRGGYSATNANNTIGFRCVRSR